MENYVYEKEYPFPEDIDEREGDEADAIREYLRAHPIRQEKAAHAVLPFGPRLFEKTVADCETIAGAFCGKLRAVIDYTKFTASIDLWFCCAAFRRIYGPPASGHIPHGLRGIWRPSRHGTCVSGWNCRISSPFQAWRRAIKNRGDLPSVQGSAVVCILNLWCALS